MRGLIISRCGALTPAELRARAVPLLMIQGGIHQGESATARMPGSLRWRATCWRNPQRMPYWSYNDCGALCSCVQCG